MPAHFIPYLIERRFFRLWDFWLILEQIPFLPSFESAFLASLKLQFEPIKTFLIRTLFSLMVLSRIVSASILGLLRLDHPLLLFPVLLKRISWSNQLFVELWTNKARIWPGHIFRVPSWWPLSNGLEGILRRALVQIPIEGLWHNTKSKDPLPCQSKGLDTMPIEKLVMRPIERPFADVNRRMLCRCQSKSILEMPIEMHFGDANRKALWRCQSKGIL